MELDEVKKLFIEMASYHLNNINNKQIIRI